MEPVSDRDRWSFERNARAYSEGRPRYPRRVYEFLAEIGALNRHANILEIGPGAGQATIDLQADAGHITAVELGPELASILAERVDSRKVEIVVADVHALDLGVRKYDCVVAATTFHWLNSFDLLPKFAKALKPGGWMIAWWTVFGDHSNSADTPFRVRVRQIFDTYIPGDGSVSTPPPLQVQDRIDELTTQGLFQKPEFEIIRWNHMMTAGEAVALFETFPNIASLPMGPKNHMLAALGDAVRDVGEPIEDPFVTIVYAAQVV